MSGQRRWRLFEVFGVELEYMLVDRTTLEAWPMADELLRGMAGEYVQDIERGAFAWSNEIVCHVIELKTNGPADSLGRLGAGFHGEVDFINARLAGDNAMMLGTGAHPLFDPGRQTRLWPHGDREIYTAYDRIFGCRGHGWSNLQSVHLNLPFADDDEFGRLHAAIRLVLPLIPALSASTPVLDGRVTGYLDTRLETYRHNQARIPSIAGCVIPEAVFSEAGYRERILERIRSDIAPHDPDGVLDPVFLNSRGAIARFDRGAIEIRVIDTQEAPVADLAILDVVVALIRALVAERFVPYDEQRQWPEDRLAGILLSVVRDAEEARIGDREYLRMFGVDRAAMTAGELWGQLAESLNAALDPGYRPALRHILDQGPVARRILRQTGSKPSGDRLRLIWSELAACLATNRQLP